MRLKISVSTTVGSILPINYTYGLSSFIYKTLEEANHKFAAFLHNEGYKQGHKQFKLFCFSPLYISKYTQFKDRLIFQERNAYFFISFFLPDPMKDFVTGLFKQQKFFIGDRDSRVDFTIEMVNLESKPTFQETMKYRCRMPICISQNVQEKRYAQYLSPTHTAYETLFIRNLLNKYQAALHTETDARPTLDTQAFEANFKLLSPTPKSKLLTIKSSKIKGYLFDFELTAPVELQEVGFSAGFGGKNSVGFGFCDVLR